MSEYDGVPDSEKYGYFEPNKSDWDKKGSLSTTPPPLPPGMVENYPPPIEYPQIHEQKTPPLNAPESPLSTMPPPLPPGMQGGQEVGYPPLGTQETPPLNAMPLQQEMQGGQELSYPPLGEQEIPPLDIKDAAEERRAFYEQVAAPEMRASLDRFTVSEYTDVIGTDLKNRIGEAFSYPAEFSNRRNEAFYYDLYLAKTDANVQDVREVVMDNGETKLVRMRAYDDKGLITTEVFNPNIKPNILRKPGRVVPINNDLIVYEKFVVSKDTGKNDQEPAVDLIDLVVY